MSDATSPKEVSLSAGKTIVLGTKRFVSQDMPHHAAALTYYLVLALFPALLVAVSLLGLLGSGSTVNEIGSFMKSQGVDPSVVDGVMQAAQSAVQAQSASVFALIFGLLLALNGASGAVGAVGKALNVVLEVEDNRSFVKKKLKVIVTTVVVLVLSVVATMAVFVGGSIAETIFDVIGVGHTAATLWSVLRWPLALLAAVSLFAWLYYSAPAAPSPSFRWISLGAVCAVGVWLAGTLLFFFYVNNFASYNATYGVFAGAVVALIWLWLTNIALLLGAEINAAGRWREHLGSPVSEKGDNPEQAQHQAVQQDTAKQDKAQEDQTSV